LETKLKQAEHAISSFEERWMVQNQAIQSAKLSLCQMEKEQEAAAEEKAQLLSQLSQERLKYNQLKEQLASLDKNNHFSNALQVSFKRG
jgi:chromosome segregation ATPase